MGLHFSVGKKHPVKYLDPYLWPETIPDSILRQRRSAGSGVGYIQTAGIAFREKMMVMLAGCVRDRYRAWKKVDGVANRIWCLWTAIREADNMHSLLMHTNEDVLLQTDLLIIRPGVPRTVVVGMRSSPDIDA
jgi:hypothetical protein